VQSTVQQRLLQEHSTVASLPSAPLPTLSTAIHHFSSHPVHQRREPSCRKRKSNHNHYYCM
jgi:hypothetical protein